MGINSILTLLAIALVVIVVVLIFVYLSISAKEKKLTEQQKQEIDRYTVSKIAKEYSIGSIFDFMEFDKIEDNMIVQKNGNRYLMAIECQGINYDLMSQMEKVGVEKGFIQFLNTLRNPIQIYVQTRTINLESSIQNYKERLKAIEDDLTKKEEKYRSLIENNSQDQQQLDNLRYEIVRQNNLFEYGRDIILNTEKMSQNKNVLRKKYYIIISYYYSSIDGDNLEKHEIKELAFADLYAKAQSVIRTLSSTGVIGKILNSYDLIDLLYNAYNRDESEKYGVEKAMQAGYDDLYSTAPDVLEKKMKAIEDEIGEKALELAKQSVLFSQEEKEKEIKEKEENMDDLIDELAKQLIVENSQYMPDDIVVNAINNVEKTTQKRRGRPKKVKEAE